MFEAKTHRESGGFFHWGLARRAAAPDGTKVAEWLLGRCNVVYRQRIFASCAKLRDYPVICEAVCLRWAGESFLTVFSFQPSLRKFSHEKIIDCIGRSRRGWRCTRSIQRDPVRHCGRRSTQRQRSGHQTYLGWFERQSPGLQGHRRPRWWPERRLQTGRWLGCGYRHT